MRISGTFRFLFDNVPPGKDAGIRILLRLVPRIYISIPVYTLSFAEYLNFKQNDSHSPKELLNDYLRFGGFPIVARGNFDERSAYQIVEGIYNSVITSEITRRHNIMNFDLFADCHFLRPAGHISRPVRAKLSGQLRGPAEQRTLCTAGRHFGRYYRRLCFLNQHSEPCSKPAPDSVMLAVALFLVTQLVAPFIRGILAAEECGGS